MPALTVLTAIVIPSMQDLLILRQGQTPSDDDSNLVFNAANAMIDRWNADRLCSTGLDTINLGLTAHKGVYTIGLALAGDPPADFVRPRPVLIQNAVIAIAGLELPIRIVEFNEWAAVREKTSEAQLPELLFCDYNWPVATINFHDIPLGAVSTFLKIMAWRPLPLFTSLTQEINLPPAYIEAIEFNLAVRVAGKFGRQIPPQVLQMAADSKASIRMLNAQTAGMPPEAAAPPQQQPAQ